MITKEALHQEKLMRCFFVSQDNTFLIEKIKTYEKKRKQKKIEDNFRKVKIDKYNPVCTFSTFSLI